MMQHSILKHLEAMPVVPLSMSFTVWYVKPLARRHDGTYRIFLRAYSHPDNYLVRAQDGDTALAIWHNGAYTLVFNPQKLSFGMGDIWQFFGFSPDDCDYEVITFKIEDWSRLL